MASADKFGFKRLMIAVRRFCKITSLYDVRSGSVPSTLEFLQPEDTLEQNTDSLRDFIISLDKKY